MDTNEILKLIGDILTGLGTLVLSIHVGKIHLKGKFKKNKLTTEQKEHLKKQELQFKEQNKNTN